MFCDYRLGDPGTGSSLEALRMPLRETEGIAPDLVFRDAQRGPVRLSEYWQAGPAVLIFLRHFG